MKLTASVHLSHLANMLWRDMGEGFQISHADTKVSALLRKRKSRHFWRIFKMRRRRDLNSRRTFALAGFRNQCLQPLSHSSKIYFVFWSMNGALSGCPPRCYSDKMESSFLFIHSATPPKYTLRYPSIF